MNFKGKIIDFELEYRKRKSLEIQIKPDGRVRVLAPSFLTKQEVMDQIKTKGDWILSNLDHFESLDLDKIKKNFQDGEEFLYLGKTYKLRVLKKSDRNGLILDKTNINNLASIAYVNNRQGKNKPIIGLDGESLIIKTDNKDKDYLKQDLISWYKEQGLEIIKERVSYYQAFIPVKPTDIVVKEQKRRWGTCTAKGRLLFNWRIIMAPLSVVDYVVVHEMCHLIHMNHSRDYWNSLERVIPNYKEAKDWLKTNGIWLNIE